MNAVIGHQRLKGRLAQIALRRPGSLLFVGPVGIGKRTLALSWAKSLTQDRFELPVTPGFVRSERVFGLSPEGTQVKMEAVRELLNALAVDRDGQPAVVIVDRAEALGGNSANALLKVVEEPPPGVTFIFIAPSESHVLPTLRSRSQVVQFSALSDAEMRDAISAMGRGPIEPVALDLARGSVGRYFELVSEGSQELQQLCLSASQAVIDHCVADESGGSDDLPSDEFQSVREMVQQASASREGLQLLLSILQVQALGRMRERSRQGLDIERFNRLCSWSLLAEDDLRGHIDRALIVDVLLSRIEHAIEPMNQRVKNAGRTHHDNPKMDRCSHAYR